MNELIEELQSALHAIWNRRWLALGVAWGVCLLGWLAIALIPNSYESQARLFVELDDALAEQLDIGSNARMRDIERVRQSLTGAINLEKVIRSTQIGETITTPREMDMAIIELAKNVQVSSEAGNLFVLTAESGRSDLSDSENAVLAQNITQKMIDIFREENIAGGRGKMQETLTFLDQQLEARQLELEAAEQRRVAFEAGNPEIIGGTGALTSNLAATRAELRNVEADLAAAQSSLAAINGQIASTPRSIVSDGAGGGSRGALMQAQSNLSSLRARGLTGSHPDIVAAERQVDALEKQVSREGPTSSSIANPAYSSLQSIRAERQANVQSLSSRKAALQSELGSISANQSVAPSLVAEANRINRDYEVLKTKYDELLQDREELKLRGQVENERSAIQFEVIDPPTTPRIPSAPNRPLLLLGVLILGIGAGIAVALGLSKLKSTFSTTSKLESVMDLPVLGAISHTLTDAGRTLAARRMKMFTAACAGLAGMFVVLLAVEFIQRGMVA
ncbi:XrtA system polysaccharide chain length determinant [Altererythrobacter aquiaggeris]|uniref:XrtA system polysaccharide chain length determinant n=1 Tax=Aestuarierythrobacter aquiaggeris TaxID=1898396 RepID=UPI00301A53F4